MKMQIALTALMVMGFSGSVFAAPNVCVGLFNEARSSGVRLKPKTMDQLLREHQEHGNPVIAARKLKFLGTGGRDVYNQTSTFKAKINGEMTEIKFGRVEPRENHDSQVWAFKKVGEGVFAPIESIAPLKGEDPFFEFVGKELWLGFVETYDVGGGNLGYRTVVYRDHGLGADHLERAIELPRGMKDTRFAKIIAGPDKGQIRLVARPQNSNEELGGRGKNSFTNLRSMDQLTPESVKEAKILHGQVKNGDWIGTNKVFPLTNGDVVYLSHVAHYESEASGYRGYFVTAYSDRFPEPRIILVRSDIEGSLKPALARGGSKRADLVNVLFSGGFREVDEHTGVLDVGAGDAEAWEVVIPNFLTWYRNQAAK